MNEADTCRTYVLPKLNSAGWEDEYISEQMVLTSGRIVSIGDRSPTLHCRDASQCALLPSVLDKAFNGEL
jgi:hypothetical protein